MSYVLEVALLCATFGASVVYTAAMSWPIFHRFYRPSDWPPVHLKQHLRGGRTTAGQLALENVGAAGAVQRAPLKAKPIRIDRSAKSTKHPCALQNSIARHVSKAS